MNESETHQIVTQNFIHLLTLALNHICNFTITPWSSGKAGTTHACKWNLLIYWSV